jgi:transposase
LKTARDRLDIITAYEETGSYRSAAELCGTTHKTVKRIVEASRAGQDPSAPRREVERNIDGFRDLVADKVDATKGRISAKRLLPIARAEGYEGSDRNFRRLVAEVKSDWRRQARVFRPWIHSPGEHLVIDWAEEGRWKVFCAVLGWSRIRFVRFASDMTTDTTLRLLAECLEEIGGVPAVVLSDRMSSLRGQIVANQVVANASYVRFATHYRFRPDWCEAEDPQSKGLVENLAGYVQRDLIVASQHEWQGVDDANVAARAWCDEVNAAVHSEIAAVPAQRLVTEREVLRALPSLRPPLRRGERRKVDRLATVRFSSARYSVPAELVGVEVEVAAEDQHIVIFHGRDVVASHPLVAPGEVSIVDDHYGGPRRAPARAVRPRSAGERAFLQLGAVAEDFLRAAAAAGTPRLSSELAAIVELARAWDRPQVIAALERGLVFRRFTAADVRSILEAGVGVADVTDEGDTVDLDLPHVEVRDLSAYALEEWS